MPRAAFCVSSERRHTLWQARSAIASQTQKCRSPEKRTCRSCSPTSAIRSSAWDASILPRRFKDRRTWFRYSQGIGGDAITFLQQFCDKTFPEAVEYLLTFQGKARDAPVKTKPVTKQDEPPKEFALPPRNVDDRRVFAYLRKRGIAAQVIRQFMNSGSLYEDAVHHNCVFVGRDHSIRCDLCTIRQQANGYNKGV